MKNRFLMLSLAVVALTATRASSYVIDTDGKGHPLHWGNSTVGYRMVAGNAPGGALGEAAVHAAFATWSAVTPGLNYVFEGFEGAPKAGYDKKNVVYWVYSGWSYDASLLAVTLRYFNTSDGRLLDADILFNAARYPWSVGGSTYDVENSAAHEVGHFSGLGHSSDSGATMYASASPGETRKRTLAGDDVAGMTANYGGGAGYGGVGNSGVVESPAAGVGGGGGGGCSIGAKPSAANLSDLLWIGALLFGLALRRSCFGRWALQGFADDEPRSALSGAFGRGAGLQHERSVGQALYGVGGAARLLGSSLQPRLSR